MLMYTSLQDSSQMVGVLLPHDCRSCSDNPNKEFADCSIPQEKSDAEINRELEISENSLCDEEDDTDATGDKPMEDCIQGRWIYPAFLTFTTFLTEKRFGLLSIQLCIKIFCLQMCRESPSGLDPDSSQYIQPSEPETSGS